MLINFWVVRRSPEIESQCDFRPWLENILVLELSRSWEESEKWLQNTFEHLFLGEKNIFFCNGRTATPMGLNFVKLRITVIYALFKKSGNKFDSTLQNKESLLLSVWTAFSTVGSPVSHPYKWYKTKASLEMPKQHWDSATCLRLSQLSQSRFCCQENGRESGVASFAASSNSTKEQAVVTCCGSKM